MLYEKLNDRTMLIIAHRLSTIRHCDAILLVDGGEIKEQGTHDELMELRGKYYELWQMQQGNVVPKKKQETVNAQKTKHEDSSDEMSYR